MYISGAWLDFQRAFQAEADVKKNAILSKDDTSISSQNMCVSIIILSRYMDYGRMIFFAAQTIISIQYSFKLL